MIEKEYQQKMKNAIWSSVPSLGMLVAGGNLVTTAISLASQVGIGYMNYRRKKSEYVIERDRKEWELQKTAIEQFNGLRRECYRHEAQTARKNRATATHTKGEAAHCRYFHHRRFRHLFLGCLRTGGGVAHLFC